MLLAGDESGNTQEGNNNAYSSDDPIGWVDFARGKRNKELAAFVKGILAFRKAHPLLHMDTELKGSDYRSFGMPDISFHDTKAWYGSFDRQARSLAVLYNGKYGDPDDGAVYAAYNAIPVKDKKIRHGIGMTHSCRGDIYAEFSKWQKEVK